MTVFPNYNCKVCACLFLLTIFNISCCSASTIDGFSTNMLGVAGLSEFDSSLQWTISDVVNHARTANTMNPSNIGDYNGRQQSPSFFSGKDLTEMTVSILGQQVAVTIPIPASFWLLGFGLMGLSVFINRWRIITINDA